MKKKKKTETEATIRGFLVNDGWNVHLFLEPRQRRHYGRLEWFRGARERTCEEGWRRLGLPKPRPCDGPVPFVLTIKLGD